MAKRNDQNGSLQTTSSGNEIDLNETGRAEAPQAINDGHPSSSEAPQAINDGHPSSSSDACGLKKGHDDPIGLMKFFLNDEINSAFHSGKKVFPLNDVVEWTKWAKVDIPSTLEIAQVASLNDLLKSFGAEFDLNGDIVVPESLPETSPKTAISPSSNDSSEELSFAWVGKEIQTVKAYFNECIAKYKEDGDMEKIKYQTFADGLENDQSIAIEELADVAGQKNGKSFLELLGVKIDSNGYIVPELLPMDTWAESVPEMSLEIISSIDSIQHVVKKLVANHVFKNLSKTLPFHKVIRGVEIYDGTDINQLAVDCNFKDSRELLRSIYFGFNLEYDSNGDIVVPADLSVAFVDKHRPYGGMAVPSVTRANIEVIKKYFNQCAAKGDVINYQNFVDGLHKEHAIFIQNITGATGFQSDQDLLKSFGIKFDLNGDMEPESIQESPPKKAVIEVIELDDDSDDGDDHGNRAEAAIHPPPPKRRRIADDDGRASKVSEDLFEEPVNRQQYLYAGKVDDLKWGMQVKVNGKIFVLPTFPTFFRPTETDLNAQYRAVERFNQILEEIVMEYDADMQMDGHGTGDANNEAEE